MVTGVTVNHGKFPDGEGYHLSFNYHGNLSVENLRDTLSKSHYAGAACNVRLLCSEEDMTVAVLKAFFCLQRNQI